MHDLILNSIRADDAGSGGEPEQVRILDFWLRRVKSLYAQVGRNPPAILLLHLWGYGAKNKLINPQGPETLDRQPRRYIGPLVDSYRVLGWDIAMVNVGAIINATAIRSGPSPLNSSRFVVDDTNHPSCRASHVISDILQHAFYTNLASPKCTVPELKKNPNYGNNQSRTPSELEVPEPKFIVPQRLDNFRALWKDLFRRDVRIGSLSSWEPRVHNITTLKGFSGHNSWESISTWPTILRGNADPHRSDREYVFRLPLCPNTNNASVADPNRLVIRLKDPDLKWIGLNLQGRDRNIYVNNVQITETAKVFAKDWCYGSTHISHWIAIGSHGSDRNTTFVEAAEEYEISFCRSSQSPSPMPLLAFFIGVSFPENDG